MAGSEAPLLVMSDISKSFPGVRALDKVSLTVHSGTVHALMGENGAGKSTLMKCLFGIYSKDSGRIFLDGKEVAFRAPGEALEHGVAMVHQELNQALKRSVADNIWLGRYPTTLGVFTSESRMYTDTKRIFEDLAIKADPRRIMSTMPVSERQMVEIAKAVSYGARVIVFDEPTSSLNSDEAERLFEIIERLKARGCGIIYISHKMEEILRISDEVTVMRDGRLVVTERAEDLTMEQIIRYMVGRELGERFPEKASSPGDVMLSVEDLSGEYTSVKNVSFDVMRGEILGIAGLAGSGRTEVLENIFGLSARRGGKIVLNGRVCRNRSAREAKKNGFALITEERRATGIFGILDITANTTIAGLDRYRRAGIFLSESAMRSKTREMIKALRIKAPSPQSKIRTLSGGNQQKVILARWLLTEPAVLLLDEPTRGIDVGAKYEIYSLIVSLAAQGHSVIMVSSEMPELLGVCDRILVMSGGRLAGEVKPDETTQEEIMALAAKYV